VSSRHDTSEGLIILGPYPPPFGGVAIFNDNLFEAVRGEHSNTELWTNADLCKEGQRIHFFKTGLIGNIKFLINHAAKRTILDSTVSSAEYPNFKSILAWVLLKPFLKFKWIKVIHDGTLPARHQTFGIFQKFLLRLSLRSYDRVLTVNKKLFNWAKHLSPSNLDIHQITSLLPPKDLEIETALPQTIKDKLRTCDKRVCTMGAFTNNYGFKQIVNAVENLRNQHDLDIHLVMIAGGFTKDINYRDDLLRGRDWAHAFTDLPHPQALQVLKASNVFVRATKEESYGLCKVESILCGTPVLATNTGETRGMSLYDPLDANQLQIQLYKILYEQRNPDLKSFQELFKREAQQNLQSILSVININS